MHSPHDICRIGLHRIFIRKPHQGLSRHMNHNFGLRQRHCSLQTRQIANVSDNRMHPLAYSSFDKKTRISRRCKGVASQFSTKTLQPQRKPASLKTGMPGQKNSPSTPKIRVHVQTFQGAPPRIQRSSSKFLSRKVSMGCQKPSCLKAFNCPDSANVSKGSFSQTVLSSRSRSITLGDKTK